MQQPEKGIEENVASEVILIIVIGLNSRKIRHGIGYFTSNKAKAELIQHWVWEAIGYFQVVCRLY